MKENQYNEYEVLKKAKEGDDESLNYLISRHTPLIYSLLKRYHYEKSDEEDLLASARLGLIKAINNFNLDLGFEFSTYAVPLILGEIRKYFRDGKLVSVSRGAKENLKKILSVENIDLYSLSIAEISQLTSLSKEEVIEALETNVRITSLDAPIDDNGEITLLDTISLDEKIDPEIYDLKEAINSLNKKEKLFIELRFYDGLTQGEIAERFFTSQVQISRLEKKILSKLKEYILHNPSHTKV